MLLGRLKMFKRGAYKKASVSWKGKYKSGIPELMRLPDKIKKYAVHVLICNVQVNQLDLQVLKSYLGNFPQFYKQIKKELYIFTN